MLCSAGPDDSPKDHLPKCLLSRLGRDIGRKVNSSKFPLQNISDLEENLRNRESARSGAW